MAPSRCICIRVEEAPMWNPLSACCRTSHHPPTARDRAFPGRKFGAGVIFTALTLLSGGSQTAQAQLGLAWNDCAVGGQKTLTFSCDRNDGSALLVGSLVSPSGIVALSGIEATLDCQAGTTTLPDWWTFGSGCAARSSALTAVFDFTHLSSCSDYWQGQAFGSVNIQPGFGGSNRMKLVVTGTMDGSAVGPVVPNQSYYAFALRISYAGTTGPGACSGCGAGACIALNSVTLRQVPPYSTITVTYPGSNVATWQPAGYPAPGSCIVITPVRAATWGSIKSLYR